MLYIYSKHARPLMPPGCFCCALVHPPFFPFFVVVTNQYAVVAYYSKTCLGAFSFLVRWRTYQVPAVGRASWYLVLFFVFCCRITPRGCTALFFFLFGPFFRSSLFHKMFSPYYVYMYLYVVMFLATELASISLGRRIGPDTGCTSRRRVDTST